MSLCRPSVLRLVAILIAVSVMLGFNKFFFSSPRIYVADWIVRGVEIGLFLLHPRLRQLAFESFTSRVPFKGVLEVVFILLIVLVVVVALRLNLHPITEGYDLALFAWPPYNAAATIRLLDLTMGLLLVAVSEELLFRVGLIRALEDKGLQKGPLYVLAVLLFVALHWAAGVNTWISAAILGSFQVYLFRKYRSVWPIVFTHFFMNLFVFTSGFQEIW